MRGLEDIKRDEARLHKEFVEQRRQRAWWYRAACAALAFINRHI